MRVWDFGFTARLWAGIGNSGLDYPGKISTIAKDSRPAAAAEPWRTWRFAPDERYRNSLRGFENLLQGFRV